MLNQVARLSVNFWDVQVHTVEQLSARIREIIPLAQVETVKAYPEHSEQQTLWVSFEATSADAIASITDLLQIEFNPSIYSYHWYSA